MEAFSLAPVPSQHSVQFALEANLGAFERRGVRVGDKVDLAKVPPAADSEEIR